MCEWLNIRMTRTTAYRPRSDGLAEKLNRTRGYKLNVHLLKILMAYRSSIHESIKYIPSFAMFKSEIALPVETIIGSSPLRDKHLN